MKLYHAMHCRSKSRRFSPIPSLGSRLSRQRPLAGAISGTEVETLPPPDDGRLATLPPAYTRLVGFGHTERAVGYHQSLRFVALGKL